MRHAAGEEARKKSARDHVPLRSRGRCPRAQTVEHDVLMRSLLLASLRGGLALCARENPLLGAASARQNRARSAPRPRVRTPFASVISPRAPSRTRPAGWTPRRACTKAGRRACSGWMGRPRSSTTARWDTRAGHARAAFARPISALALALGSAAHALPPPHSPAGLLRREDLAEGVQGASPGGRSRPAPDVFSHAGRRSSARGFLNRARRPPPERNAPATGSRGTRRRARVLPPAPSTIVPAPPLDAPARASPRASPPPRASTPRI